MSQYHPLDVRHPANRDMLSKTYLLDPPRMDTGTPASRATAHTTTRRTEARSAPTARPTAPWGTAAPTTTRTTEAAPRRISGTWVWLLLFAGIFAWQNGFLDDLIRWARLTALQFGISLPL